MHVPGPLTRSCASRDSAQAFSESQKHSKRAEPAAFTQYRQRPRNAGGVHAMQAASTQRRRRPRDAGCFHATQARRDAECRLTMRAGKTRRRAGCNRAGIGMLPPRQRQGCHSHHSV
eukprot:354906-Chlamydomonas_euryale.AAC.1